MTINDSIIQWLSGFGDIAIDDRVSTDQLEAEARAMGLYATPQTSVAEYLDGSRSIVGYYTFLTRRSSQTDASRKSNQEWLESLQAWVRRQSLSGNLPRLEGGRTCDSIHVANTFYLQSQTEEESVYQMTIAISYVEMRGE